jgi:hypothetical protein
MNDLFNNYFSPMDIHFSRFIASFTRQNKEDLFLAVALVSRYVRDGHICLDWNDIAGKIIFKSKMGKTSALQNHPKEILSNSNLRQ